MFWKNERIAFESLHFMEMSPKFDNKVVLDTKDDITSLTRVTN